MNNEECIELMLFEWFILFNFIDSLVRKRREMFICLVKIAFCAETISQKIQLWANLWFIGLGGDPTSWILINFNWICDCDLNTANLPAFGTFKRNFNPKNIQSFVNYLKIPKITLPFIFIQCINFSQTRKTQSVSLSRKIWIKSN